MICFTGIDGSGKTTIAKDLAIYLQNKNLPSVYVYGRYKLMLTKIPIFIANRLFLSGNEMRNDYIKSTKKKNRLFNNYRSIANLYMYALLIDYLFQLIIKIKIPLLFGKIVICDRYIYDTIITDFAIDMNFDKGKIFSLIDRCFLIVPKPQIVFLIDIDEKMAFSRKNDVCSIKYLTDRRFLYLQLRERYNVSILDGNDTREIVFSQCLRRLNYEFDI